MALPDIEITGCEKRINGANPNTVSPTVQPDDQITVAFQVRSTRADDITTTAALFVDGARKISERITIPANDNTIVRFGPFTPGDIGVGSGETRSIEVDVGAV